jgi:hypothetical protein
VATVRVLTAPVVATEAVPNAVIRPIQVDIGVFSIYSDIANWVVAATTESTGDAPLAIFVANSPKADTLFEII